MRVASNPFKLTFMVLTAAIAASAAMAVYAQPAGGPFGGHRMHGAMAGGDGPRAGMHLSDRMLDRINATPEQRTQIRQIMDSARKDLQAQRGARRALRDQAVEVFVQPNVDANAAEAVRQKMLAQHDAASKRMTQAMVEASRVLTPEQRAQIASSLKHRREMMERHHRERRALDAPKT